MTLKKLILLKKIKFRMLLGNPKWFTTVFLENTVYLIQLKSRGQKSGYIRYTLKKLKQRQVYSKEAAISDTA